MKVDINDRERKALAAKATWWLRSRDTQMVVGDGRTGPAGLYLGEANIAHIAANGPDEVLALIARIRELEAVVASLAGVPSLGDVDRPELRIDLRALLEKGAVLP